MIDWLDGMWSRTHVVQIVEGGEDAGPLANRAVLAELRDAAEIGTARMMSTAGRFTGDICRCHGGPTILLRDVAGRVLAGGSLHGFGTVSWERSRFRNDLVMADPAGLHLLLAEHGVPGQLTPFLASLMDLLDLHERDGEPQFRPAGTAGQRRLTERGVPIELQPVLAAVTGHQAGELSEAQTEEIRQRLAAAVVSPRARAVTLLTWLGHLPIPAEAFWGEGVLVRRLLTDLSAADIAAAAAGTRTGHVAMGVLNLIMFAGDDGALSTAISPTLRQLFPPGVPGTAQ